MPYFIMKSRKLSLRSVIEQDACYQHTVLQVLANVGRKEKLKSIIKSTSGKKNHIRKYNCTTERPKVSSKSIRFKILQKDCRVLWTGEN